MLHFFSFLWLSFHFALAERERVSATNVASTMAAMMATQPLLPVIDLSSLRIVSCGGSPQPPAVVSMRVMM
jgi:hypothetical protein